MITPPPFPLNYEQYWVTSCGGAAPPPSHIAMSGLANVVFLYNELGQLDTCLYWIWYSKSGQLSSP